MVKSVAKGRSTSGSRPLSNFFVPPVSIQTDPSKLSGQDVNLNMPSIYGPKPRTPIVPPQIDPIAVARGAQQFAGGTIAALESQAGRQQQALAGGDPMLQALAGNQMAQGMASGINNAEVQALQAATNIEQQNASNQMQAQAADQAMQSQREAEWMQWYLSQNRMAPVGQAPSPAGQAPTPHQDLFSRYGILGAGGGLIGQGIIAGPGDKAYTLAKSYLGV